jgi:predicted alpha/beta superfamily hydrolase
MALTSRVAAPLLALVVAAPLWAQRPVTIPNSERYVVQGTQNRVDYQIDVALPSGYAASEKRYPVFYVLDANLAFATLVDTYRLFRIEGTVPELILVGIGYPEEDPAVYTPAYAASRSRDYTPTHVESAIPSSGHAREFLAFIKEQLIPMIDGRYRTDPSDRALGGHSLGGLFTTYVLLTDPTLFRRYWIGSPSLWWDNQVSFTYLPAALQRPEQPEGRAFLTVGGLETAVMVPPMERMAARLKASFPKLEVGSMVYPDETHMSVVNGAVSRALRFLYGKSSVPITLADARAYVGRWKAASGEEMTIALQGSRPMITMAVSGSTVTVELFAEARDHLFAKSFGLELVAERDQVGKVIRFARTFLNAEAVFERVR